MTSSMTDKKVAVVGGGLAGVTAARELSKAGTAVTVFEKSRGLGGRLATRRMDGGFSADHGAQYFTARTQEFQAYLNEAIGQGAVGNWTPEPGGEAASQTWFVGAPAMNSFLKTEPLGFDLKVGTHVAAVAATETGVELTMMDGGKQGFDQAIITAPAPQAEAMLVSAHPDMAAALAAVEIAPNWTLMLVFEQEIDPGFTVWREDHPVLGWVARNSSKPGRDFNGDSWTVQANADWSTEFLELEKEDAAVRLFDAFQALVGRELPPLRIQTAHRWRYAKTITPLGQPFLKDASGHIYVAGDWCLGARVEYAFESGRAAAQAMIAT